jgi:aminoglycoside/choline kinase family phosphotransferase/dTDP-glucose pyrophosphorylase
MKAMILAAGLGTRLAPYTDHTPKPLFTIGQRPVLDHTISHLKQAGCRHIIINTHHLHEQIADHVAGMVYGIDIRVRYEPEILGTGGGIANIADWWEDGPLMVINGDIVCDIDLSEVIGFHQKHPFPVTMVMHDHPEFNIVSVNDGDFVISFDRDRPPAPNIHMLAFTGIHILESEVLNHLPADGFASIIDAYRRLLESGRAIKAMIARDHYWNDIGTPERYRSAVFDHMAPCAFEKAFGVKPVEPIDVQPLHGDGSDRQWFRLTCQDRRIILADHHIRNAPPPQEADAYVAIGRHLQRQGVPVPQIYLADTFCGLVFVEDLGDLHLQAHLQQQPESEQLNLYRRVIDHWTTMAMEGKNEFDPNWTYQTPRYDRELILEKEARYFTEAFLQGYLGWKTRFDDLAEEFNRLAGGALDDAVTGFIHRDFQSRNIMIHGGKIGFIDFQGGRLGPIQYDLAALLIDPYTELSHDVQDHLLNYAAGILNRRYGIDMTQFLKGYAFCAVTRNLQMLGAFAYLSRVKGKTDFEAYIPLAVQRLVDNLEKLPLMSMPRLRAIVEKLALQRVGR